MLAYFQFIRISYQRDSFYKIKIIASVLLTYLLYFGILIVNKLAGLLA